MLNNYIVLHVKDNMRFFAINAHYFKYNSGMLSDSQAAYG